MRIPMRIDWYCYIFSYIVCNACPQCTLLCWLFFWYSILSIIFIPCTKYCFTEFDSKKIESPSIHLACFRNWRIWLKSSGDQRQDKLSRISRIPEYFFTIGTNIKCISSMGLYYESSCEKNSFLAPRFNSSTKSLSIS